MVTNMLKRLTNKYANFKILALCLLVLVNVILAKVLANYKLDLISKRQELALVRRDLNLLNKLASDYENSKSKQDSILSSMPQSYFDVAVFTYKLENIARSFGLVPVVSYDRDSKENDGLLSVKVKITTKGNYVNYKSFLSGIANLPYNTSIDSSSFTSKDGDIEQITILTIYLRK